MCLVGKDNSKNSRNYQKQNIKYKLNILEHISNLVAFVSENCKKNVKVILIIWLKSLDTEQHQEKM
jgi:hypothetical protein